MKRALVKRVRPLARRLTGVDCELGELRTRVAALEKDNREQLAAVERQAQERVAVVDRQLGELRKRATTLEEEVQEARRLNQRVAELTDVVAEVVVPAADRDDERMRAALTGYHNTLL